MGTIIKSTSPLAGVSSDSRCPECKHPDLGKVSALGKWMRATLHMRPARPACPADDGMGGGPEHDGRCDCPHPFHA